MAAPTEILAVALETAKRSANQSLVQDQEVANRIEFICRDIRNRAVVRFVMTGALAKVHRPEIDIRKPYTEIGTSDTYSGRTYDERYLTPFIHENRLPCNRTTAFLTPAFRNRNTILTPDMAMVGRPEELYAAALQLLTDVETNAVSAESVLGECVRQLLIIRDENQARISTLLSGLKGNSDNTLLSAEAIVTLIEQHLRSRGSSRLPVLVVAAAYQAGALHLGEHPKTLESHNAADEQTGAVGDVEIALTSDGNLTAVYEVKAKRVTISDIDQSLHKLEHARHTIDHYVFITTDKIDENVQEYAASIYERTGHIEFVILDCIGFLRHFLHLFHRLRGAFLDAYQALLLLEPDSAVSPVLKEAFLALRQAAESNLGLDEP